MSVRWFVVVSVLLAISTGTRASVVSSSPPSWTVASSRSATIADSGPFAALIRDRTYAAGASEGSVLLNDLLRMPITSAAINGEVGFARTVAAAAVSTALADAIAVAAVGVASYEIASAVRCKALGAGATGCDDGQEKEVTTLIRTGTMATVRHTQEYGEGSSVPAACAALAGKVGGADGAYGTVIVQLDGVDVAPSGTSGTCHLKQSYRQCHPPEAGFPCSTSTPSPTDISATSVQSTQCPAVVDASNPANSVPAGGAAGPDGKCRTGRYDGKTREQVAEKIRGLTDTALKARALKEAIDAGVKTVAQPGALTGPASATGQPSTVRVTGPQGVTTTTTTPRTRFEYPGESITATDDPIVVTGNPDGTTTTTEGPPPKIEIETCGLPGKPPCKIDETGTPTAAPTPPDTPDKLKSDDAAKRDEALGKIQDPGFGWVGAPPVAQCYPFEWPSMGRTFTLDPCGPMEQIRGIMAYAWALFAAWWSLGMVRKTVAGG